MSGKREDAKKLKAAERRIQALEMRKRGMSYRSIGEVLGVSHTMAAKDVARALKDLNNVEKTEAEDLRRLMAERIDLARSAISTLVLFGSMEAVDRWLKLNEQEIKLFGLSKPDVIQLELSEDVRTWLAAQGIGTSDVVQAFEAMIRARMTSPPAPLPEERGDRGRQR
jgi:hypothetical protein